MLQNEIPRPAPLHAPENALAAMLTLLHCYALREDSSVPNPRLALAILSQLGQLSDNQQLLEPLRRTCDQLYDAWLPVVTSSCHRAGEWRHG